LSTTGDVVNIASALTEVARSRPYATAVACPAGRDRAGRTAYVHWTFQQLDRESDVLARGLAALGLDGQYARTVLMVKPGLEFFALTFALFKAGAVPVLIDPGMGVRNLGRCLEEAKPRAFIGIPRAQLARRALGWARPWLQVSVTVRPVDPARPAAPLPELDPNAFPQSVSLAQVRQAGLSLEPFPVATARSGDLAAILFTSGSTGPPKGAEYTHGIFAAQVAMLRDLYGIETGEVDLCTFPLFALFAPALGMTAVVPEMDATRPARVDPLKILDAVENFGVTNLFGSPALLKRVGEYGAARGVKLPTLRRVVSAGAPVPARVLERFATMLAPGVQIFTPYGATEALPVASIGSDEILGETRHATDLGAGVCVGRPVPGMRVEVIRISDDAFPVWSDDLTVPDGQIGELVVQGPVVTRSYFDLPEPTLSAKISGAANEFGNCEFSHFTSNEFRAGQYACYGHDLPDPLFHRMGDLGYRDPQGRIWFCGRKSHRVTAPGGTLYTIPCEAVFNTHSEVNRTALVGVGPAGNQRPVLWVEPNRWPLSKAERAKVVDELKGIGAKYQHTRAIETFLFRRTFPVDTRHNAKIFREKLALRAARRVR
jgi:acyl-CoA synthetase (AMP-forming)/AMP-acid ligase II